MSKVEKLIDELNEQYQHLDNLDLLDSKLLFEKYESCKKDDKKKNFLQYVDIIKKDLKDKEKIIFKKDRRKFIMNFVIDVDDLVLDVTEEGVLSKLKNYLSETGSCKIEIKGVTSKASMCKYLGMGKVSLDNVLNKFGERNIMKLVKINNTITEFYINPYYIRYGNIITEEARKLFNLDSKLFTIGSTE